MNRDFSDTLGKLRPQVDTAGYSPEEMWIVLNDTFGEESPIQLRQITEDDCEQIPLFRQVEHLMKMLLTVGEIKLTQKGNLPLAMVKELYEFGVRDKMVEQGIIKFRSEDDCESVPIAREIAKLIGAVKKRNNKLSMTSKGKRMLADKPSLATSIITTACTTYQAAFMDIFWQEATGAFETGFVLLLLNKHGGEDRPVEYYYDGCLYAFPDLRTEYEALCPFMFRMFERRLLHLGVVDLTKHKIGAYETETHVVKTPLFDKLFQCRQSGYLQETRKS